jgi:hypothetical protein
MDSVYQGILMEFMTWSLKLFLPLSRPIDDGEVEHAGGVGRGRVAILVRSGAGRGSPQRCSLRIQGSSRRGYALLVTAARWHGCRCLLCLLFCNCQIIHVIILFEEGYEFYLKLYLNNVEGSIQFLNFAVNFKNPHL